VTYLQVGALRFGYGANELFRDVTFSLAAGDRAALVAPNGAGKSTLLRLIAGELAPDAGIVTVRKEVTVGYYRQSHELSSEGDVMDAFLSGFREVVELRHRLHQAQEDAASGTDEALSHLADLMDRYHAAHGDEVERKVTILAGKLGFSGADMGRALKSLSGGERGRLLLGVVLAKEPDLLLLDEPTNHLDLDTISWLEAHLSGYRGALLVVSHDRAFLDAVTTSTMELGKRSFRVFPASYSTYEALREEELAREAELVERQEAMVAKTEDFIRKNIAGQKTKQAQSRRKMLDKLEKLDRPEDVWARAEKVAFRFAPAPRTGDIVVEAKGLAASRGGRTLVRGVDLLIRRGDRIAVVGPNGSGKSTLLKLVAGMGGEEDVGDVRRGTNLAAGYFDQHLGSLDEKKSPVDEIRAVRGDMNVDATRQYLARFRFYGDDVFRTVSGMSGGERSRLALAKLLLEPRNLLYLDEPTNHLDIPAAKILEEALAGFDGTVLFVSHDRRFLETVATRVVSVRDGEVQIFNGGYADFVTRKTTAPAPAPSRPPRAQSAPKEEPKQKGAGKATYEAERAALRALEKKRRRLRELEDLVAEKESALSTLREELRSAPGDDWEALAQRAQREQALSKEVEKLMAEWSTLGDELAREDVGSSGGKR
jgi:ATP-binding cassette, subfamily F, member 3